MDRRKFLSYSIKVLAIPHYNVLVFPLHILIFSKLGLILIPENATIRLERIFSKSTDDVSSEPLAAMASRLISMDGMRIVS